MIETLFRDRIINNTDLAAVLGTRFVLAEESGATTGYRQRLIDAHETVLTELFGLAWPAPHRVVPNDATRRWLGKDPRGPLGIRALNRASGRLRPFANAATAPMIRMQRASLPFLGPAPPGPGTPSSLVDAGALYAGESVARIDAVAPAADLVHELAG